MEISFLGENSIRITGKDLAIICDPVSTKSGLATSKTTNEVTLLSVATESNSGEKTGMVIDGPGEYEVKGAAITGVPAQLHIDENGHRSTIYAISVDGIQVAYLGNIAPELSNLQVEALGEVDVLVLPVGGHGFTLDATAAAKIISQLEPKYVIPTHFDDGKTKFEVPQDKLEVLHKEIGASPEPQAKLRLTTKDLPLETQVVELVAQPA